MAQSGLIFLSLLSLLAGVAFMYLAMGSIKESDYGLAITSLIVALTAFATVGLIYSAVL
jgi:hypothetical protein